MNTIQTKQLGDKYILLDLLGVGGMAEVYRAKQLGKKGFEKQIVIKKLHPQAAQDKEIVDLFIGEARLAAMLQHENIAVTYDFGEIDGCYFLAMEYLAGVDLRTLLKKCREQGKPLEIRYSLMITAKICEGMDYAHRLKDFQNRPLNLIHRDLTPHNIFVTYDGKVKVFDFGVAKAEILDNKTRAGVVKGKLSYMSPEQVSGDKIDARSDIFSIGILLYEMLSGRRMYQGDTATLIQKCLTVEYVHLQEIIPGLPSELYAILDKALARDREERYQSCAQLQADIEDLMFSMARRTDSKSLQNYLRGLFDDEYEAAREKSSRAMEIYGTAPSLPRQDKTVVLQADTNEKTICYDSEKVEPDRRPQRVGTRMLTDKRFIIGAGLGLVILVFVLISGRPVKNDTDFLPSATNSSSVPWNQNGIRDNARIMDDLYNKAELSFAANRLIEPTDDSALKYYRKILSLDPNNSRALAGLNRIGDRFATQAELEYKESNLKDANRDVDLGLQVVPAHKRLLELKSELSNLETADRFADLGEKAMTDRRMAEAREYINKGLAEFPHYERLLTLKARNIKLIEAVVSELAEKARQRIGENNLTTPVGDSALTYFDEIKKIDPDNEVAKAGYREIADRYAAMADEAYRMLELDKAKGYVNRGLEIVPSHRRLLALKNDLSRSKPGIFFKSVGKNIRAILDK